MPARTSSIRTSLLSAALALVAISAAHAAGSDTLAQDPPPTSQDTPAPPADPATAAPAQEPGFAALDVNKDGKIDADEAKADPALAAGFSAADMDMNGSLSQQELTEFRERPPSPATNEQPKR